MTRIAYVNGRFVHKSEAVVHIEDRGYQFADAVYEVWALFGGKLADPEGHFARLERSLSELRIDKPMSRAALTTVLKETVKSPPLSTLIVPRASESSPPPADALLETVT